MSSTSTTGSFNTRVSSPSISAIKSCRGNSIIQTVTGRIYRIVHDTTRRDRAPALSKATPAQLVDTLSHPNGWWRDTAQRLLVERGDRSVTKALADKAASASDWRTRLHALWTLDGLDAIDASMVTRALEDSSREVRVGALQLAERWLGQPDHPIQAAVLKRTSDPDWAVRRQLAATLGVFPQNSTGESALIALLERYGDDPITVDAALTDLAGRESAVLQRFLESPAQTPQRTAVITTFAATIVKGGQDTAVQALLHTIAEESRPAWQRQALLAGAEAVIAGGALPGAAPAGGGPNAAANNTAPGGRGGPGGARAFPDDTGGARGGDARGDAPLRRAGAGVVGVAADGEVDPRCRCHTSRLNSPRWREAAAICRHARAHCCRA